MNQNPACQSEKSGERSVGSQSEVNRNGSAVVQIPSVGLQIFWVELLRALTPTLLALVHTEQ